MRFFDRLRIPSILLSLEPAGNIGGGGGTPAPAAAPASAPAADTGSSGGYTPGSLGALAEQAVKPAAPVPQPDPVPTLTATAAPAPAPLPGTEVQPPAEVPTAAPSAVVAPPADFAAYQAKNQALEAELGTHKTQLAEAQARAQGFEAYAPVVEILTQQPGAVDLVKILSPVLSAGLTGEMNDPRATSVGAELIKNIEAQDQRVSSALIMGTLSYYGNEIARRALEKYGMTEADIPDYQRWKTSGGAVTPAYTLDQFPAPNADMEALIPVIDVETGTTMYKPLDLNDPKDAWIYAAEKDKFERSKEDARRGETDKAAAAARQAADEKATQERTLTEQRGRIGEFAKGLADAETAAYNELNPAFTGEWEQFSDAASAMAHTTMWNDARYRALLEDGKSAAARGEGRAEAIKVDAAKIAKAHIAKAVSFYSNIVQRITSAEAASMAGRPRLPADAPAVQPGQVLQTQVTQPQPSATTPDYSNMDYAEMVRAMRANNPNSALQQAYRKLDG